MKRTLSIIFAVVAILAGGISCSKINDLDQRLGVVENDVADLKARITGGAVITSVDKTGDGYTFTMSDGKTYSVVNGKDGAPGEDGLIVDLKVEENFIVLTLRTKETVRISYQHPLSMVSLAIIPDISDGSVYSCNDDGTFALRIAVSPKKYLAKINEDSDFLCIADFRKVATKDLPENADFTVKGGLTGDSEKDGFLTASFSLTKEDLEKLLRADHVVSFSIEDKDGIHGAATAFVPVSGKKRGEAGKKFMVLSDIHFMHPDILRAEGKAFDEYNWEECKLLRESLDIFTSALEAVRLERPDFVLVCGDMTKDGEVICHQYVADAFKQLEEETGTRVLVVPGNHDMNNPHSLFYEGDKTTPAESATEAKFEEIYNNLGYSEAVARRTGYLDYMSYPADGVAVICVDSNEKNTPEKLLVQGGLSREQVAWIKQMADMAHSEGRHVLMMMHHNLVDFYDHAQLIRGANIANARYDYTNAELIDDLCAAGVDAVFSGHSHMHSITSATSKGHTIYSVVTSSLVNLPLAYRCGTISEDGVMTLTTSNLKDTPTKSGVNLRTEGDRYWMDLSKFYMAEAARVAWENAGTIFPLIGFNSREELHTFLDTRFRAVFYTFLTRTSDGDEHLVTPQENTDQAIAAVDGLIEYLDEQVSKEIIDTILQIIFEIDLDDLRQTFFEFFHSAYFNYLGDSPTMPDSEIMINLTR